MRLTRWTGAALAVAMVAGTGVSVGQYYQQGPPPPAPGYEQHGDWENTPPEFREVQQRGFHDGIEGARKDFGNHRPPDVNNRDEYRHPHVDRADRRAYREAFRRGYEVGVQHIYGRDRGPDRY